MADQTKPSRWFCRNSSTGQAQGPFDLVELAGLLRSGDINGQTLTQAEGDQSWLPFQERREFDSAKNMPASAIYQHIKDEAEEKQSPWSLRGLYYLGWLVLGVIWYGFSWGYRPVWQMHWFQNWVLDALNRFIGH
jgi:hypothetical protein